MIGSAEARLAMDRAHARLSAAALADGPAQHGGYEQAQNAFAGSGLSSDAVLREMRRIRSVNEDPDAAGAALLCFWLGWELRQIAAEAES